MSNFYCFPQNNTKGVFLFDRNAGITDYVIIEADTPYDANEKAESIGIYFYGANDDEIDCPCCGDRWEPVTALDGKPFPSLYGQDVTKTESKSKEDIAIHYLSGKIEWR